MERKKRSNCDSTVAAGHHNKSTNNEEKKLNRASKKPALVPPNGMRHLRMPSLVAVKIKSNL
jgi:hypothetical protein